MATASSIPDRDFWFGGAFGRAWEVTKSAPLQIVGLAFLFGSLPAAVWDYVQPRVLAAPPDDAGMEFLVVLPALVVSAISMTLLQAVFATIAIGHADGGNRSFGDSFVTGLRLLPASFGLAFINLLAISVGLVLLLVPGFIIGAIWAVSASALAVERVGPFKALGRSRQLTHGVRGQVFALLFIVMTLDLAYVLGFERIATLAGVADAVVDGTAPPSLLYALAEMLWGIPSDVAYPVIVAALYLELRRWKEGADTEKFAEIFS